MENKISLYNQGGMLCVQVTPESQQTGLLWIRFQTMEGKIGTLNFKPVTLSPDNKYYALDSLSFDAVQDEVS